MISLTTTFVLAARQTPTHKYCCFSSPALLSCCIYAICCMVFLIPMENTSDFSLQRQCTAVCTTEPELWIFGEPKEFGNWQVRKVRSMEHPYHSACYDTWSAPTNAVWATSCSPLSTGWDIVLCRGVNVANVPERKLCGMGWSVPAVFLPERDALKLKKQMGWNLVLIMLIGVLSLSSAELGFLCREPARKSQYSFVFSYFRTKIRYNTYFAQWWNTAVTVEILFNRVWKLIQCWLLSST